MNWEDRGRAVGVGRVGVVFVLSLEKVKAMGVRYKTCIL